MKKLIILGEEHNFSKPELKLLEKNFLSFNFIKYNEVNPHKVVQQITSIVEEKNKTVILLNTKALVPNEILSYLTSFENKEIRYISIQNFIETYLYKCYIPKELNNINFLEQITPFTLFGSFIKLFTDYLFAISILLITLPILIYTVYKIRKESPGPIFFQQKRVGLRGKEFTCIKFRSMVMDAEKDGAKFATKEDSRVYPWGKIMRSTRIDELPQLWNVLKGDMHLIGPRPERQVWIKEFEKEIPYYNERHIIKPGLTGWAQVLYPYGANAYDARQKLMYDLYYIKYWSLWLEIKTIWKTVMVVLYRKGV